jgi:hypothetical protein
MTEDGGRLTPWRSNLIRCEADLQAGSTLRFQPSTVVLSSEAS